MVGRRRVGSIKVGDLVFPLDEREFLFSTPSKIETEEDPIEVIWEFIPGIVICVLEFDPPQEYCQIQIIVEDIVGWTYSDYVRVVSKIKGSYTQNVMI